MPRADENTKHRFFKSRTRICNMVVVKLLKMKMPDFEHRAFFMAKVTAFL